MAEHERAPARPAAGFAVADGDDALRHHAQAIDAVPEQRQQRREEGDRRDHRHGRDQHPADADRADERQGQHDHAEQSDRDRRSRDDH